MEPVPSENDIYEEIKVSERFSVDVNQCYGTASSVNAPKRENGHRGTEYKKAHYQLLILLILLALLLAIAGVCVALILEIIKLKSDVSSINNHTSSSFQSLHSKINRSCLQNDPIDSECACQQIVALQLNSSIDMIYQHLSQQNDSIDFVYHQLSKKYTEVNTYTQLLFNRLEGPPGQFPFYTVASCAALPTSSPSGYYWVRASNGSAVKVYCDMALSCGEVTGGWMRVAGLDMTNSSHQCPSDLRERTDSGKRTCRSNFSWSGCSSVTFPVNALGYLHVCGKIIGYQVGSTDTFGNSARGTNPSIDSAYVDGVSLTHGNPRQHIWTFAAGLDENAASYPQHNCACTDSTQASRATPPPAFVRSDYFCDTGNRGRYEYDVFYGDDPLWDGAGCGPLNTCCSFNNPPWFYKQLSEVTYNNIEMRLCTDQGKSNEDIAVEMVDIFVQ